MIQGQNNEFKIKQNRSWKITTYKYPNQVTLSLLLRKKQTKETSGMAKMKIHIAFSK